MSIFQNIQDYYLKYTADKKAGCRLPDFRFCSSPLFPSSSTDLYFSRTASGRAFVALADILRYRRGYSALAGRKDGDIFLRDNDRI